MEQGIKAAPAGAALFSAMNLQLFGLDPLLTGAVAGYLVGHYVLAKQTDAAYMLDVSAGAGLGYLAAKLSGSFSPMIGALVGAGLGYWYEKRQAKGLPY